MKPSLPPDLPTGLQTRFHDVSERLVDLPSPLSSRVEASAARVATVSEFVLAVLSRDAEALLERLEDDMPLSRQKVVDSLDLSGLSEANAMAALRRLRHREMARIAWRDIAGWVDLQTQVGELTALADGCIELAVRYAAEQLEPRHAAPRDAGGAALPLLVLGMGKLGGGELNFSSDVDLVFLYPQSENGSPDGEEYYRRLGQLLIRLLDQVTGDGFVFRVDTRLRPFGGSGPLAVSVPAFESYLVRHGRDWERYAYVKARLITGQAHAAEVFDEILTPFVYRRYLDFGVFDALRHMKSLISQEVARKDMADNIKLGPGGIREVEFIVQAFQLVRGGRNPALRTPSLLEALPRLAEDRQLGERAVAGLERAYRFLRTLENRMQALEDRQVHALPEAPDLKARLAYAFGRTDWAEVEAELLRHRRTVEEEFERIAWETSGGAAAPSDADGVLRAAWERGSLGEVIGAMGFDGAEEVARVLGELRNGALYQRMDETGRQRLAAVVVRTVPLLARHAAPSNTLRRVLPILQAIGRRSAYLALLNENPAALETLVTLAGRSALIARQIAEHPLLLDELLDPRLFDTPPTREELAQMLRQQLGALADPAGVTDVEATLEAVRLFQRTAVFRIALADLLGHLPLMKVSDRLTDTAELVLEQSLATAWRELVAKHGKPRHGEPPALVDSGFAVIGYGKLGGLELGYGSDLDVVFLHDSSGVHQETDGSPPLDNDRFFARLAQRLIHFLSIQTSSGRLYEVDTRLRPSGRAGLIVASIDNFRRYQRKEAWTWEHQALLRSRALAGSARVREAFERERREVLVNHVDRGRLRRDVLEMRLRMRKELSAAEPGTFDLKQDPGGIADIEFLVDYWVLANAGRFPELVEHPDNVRQLEALERLGLVTAERCQRLTAGYLELRRRVHELALDEQGRVVEDSELEDVRRFVIESWNEVFAEHADDA